MELFEQIEIWQNKILTFKVKRWERQQAFDLVCSDILTKKKKKIITKNIQLPFVLFHIYCVISHTFQITVLL